MKKLLLLGMVVGLGAAGHQEIFRSPRDVATSGVRSPKSEVQSQSNELSVTDLAVIPKPEAMVLSPELVVVTNTNRPPCWPNCPPRTVIVNNGISLTFKAALGPSEYLICWSTNLNLPWTNVVRMINPDGQMHTETTLYRTNIPQMFFGLFQF